MISDLTLVLFSGGQDSTTCLYWAKEKFLDQVVTINIDYGQRHLVEVEAAKKICQMANVEYNYFQTDVFKQLGDSALVSSGNIQDSHRSSSNLPASFVPGRNIILLSIAAAFAYKRGIRNIVTGVCQTDYSGYPDCRNQTIKLLEKTLNEGMNFNFQIWTPLMWLTKAETVEMATTMKGCMEALAYSHTCYEGAVPPCGVCSACRLRAKGFFEVGISDPLIERLRVER